MAADAVSFVAYLTFSLQSHSSARTRSSIILQTKIQTQKSFQIASKRCCSTRLGRRGAVSRTVRAHSH
jgi:hypothetical protein